jgi:hypothetical protein
MASEWGRKETIFWPPHVPIWTYSAVLLTLLCTVVFGWERLISLSTLQRSYSADYVGSEIGQLFHQHGKYSLLYLEGGKKAPRFALPTDFETGLTTLPDGKTIRTFLNPAQRQVIEQVLTSRDRIHGLQGLAGTGKTTTLEAIREGAEKSGYKVEGFAPSSKAASAVREAGISANTLQSFLVRAKAKGPADPAERHLYMLDESSLASTKQMRAFLDKVKPQDRVLVIGDTGQHQGVDAGRPFEQMQDAGMRTSRLDKIMRQKDQSC